VTTATSEVYVKVRVGSETYALPVASVLEVADLGDLTELPGAGTGVLGMRNFHGQVLPVFDLAHVLGGSGDAVPSRLVVADRSGCLAGLAVDEVTDVGSLSADRAEPESEYLTDAVLEDGALVGIVDLDRVFATLRSNAR
jgi:purine-binding chemotaxis protein CheW